MRARNSGVLRVAHFVLQRGTDMRLITTSMILSSLIAVGCSTEKPVPTDEFSSLDGVDEKADAFSTHMKLLGQLAYGKVSDDVTYSKSPKYRAFKFFGKEGDKVDLWVRSGDGDAVAWLLDGHFHVVATNDDAAPDTFDAHIETTLPASSLKTHYIVFREYGYAKATFSVQLDGGDPIFACQVDADCVAVPEAACCPTGRKIAVASGEEEAYADANACHEPPHVCNKAVILDQRVAECDASTKQCVMIAPEDIRCQGFTRNPHFCPDGFTCKVNQIPDIPGTCVAN
jgi:hypothetical protein